MFWLYWFNAFGTEVLELTMTLGDKSTATLDGEETLHLNFEPGSSSYSGQILPPFQMGRKPNATMMRWSFDRQILPGTIQVVLSFTTMYPILVSVSTKSQFWGWPSSSLAAKNCLYPLTITITWVQQNGVVLLVDFALSSFVSHMFQRRNG